MLLQGTRTPDRWEGEGVEGQPLPCPGPNVSLGHSKSLRKKLQQEETILPFHSACVPRPRKQAYTRTGGLSAVWPGGG